MRIWKVSKNVVVFENPWSGQVFICLGVNPAAGESVAWSKPGHGTHTGFIFAGGFLGMSFSPVDFNVQILCSSDWLFY